jgi:hypothetical protein
MTIVDLSVTRGPEAHDADHAAGIDDPPGAACTAVRLRQRVSRSASRQQKLGVGAR